MKVFDEFSKPKPSEPIIFAIPIEPQSTNGKYNPKPPFFTKLSKKKMAKFIALNQDRFNIDHDIWVKDVERLKARKQFINVVELFIYYDTINNKKR